ncbi:MAG: TerB family tellurite resistance protein [Alistipes sp.]|jgi:hypothetical protein|uniref:tellurite resistance TerB family protein n=1 Tax=Alistipes sp. TaxID=1872444 RepID=UPI001E108921|nr:hypothetical protein [Alistipes sp.]MBS5020922.1 TerB family tellurite resistance protein [Alistipes sp.]
MGLTDLLNFSEKDTLRKQREEDCKIRDLVAMAIADGEIADVERQYILSIMEEENIEKSKLSQIINSDPYLIPDAYPVDDDHKLQYLCQLIALMIVDGNCTEQEMKFCEVIANKLNYDKKTMDQIITILTDALPDEMQKMSVLLSYLTNSINTEKL